jgi:hypothetical protein
MMASEKITRPRRARAHVRGAVSFLLLATCAGSAGEILYNGIALPDDWPPRRTAADIRAYEPMRVPYLEKRPEVVPIDIGRQLFVDDFLIERTTLIRRFHKAQPYRDNPVLRPTKGWENDIPTRPHKAIAFSDGCFFDPKDGLFKMWYLPSMDSGVSYATSTDGIHWEKPPVGVLPRSNVVLLSGQRDSSTVWLDHDAKNPAERFKLFQRHKIGGGASVHTSPDGIHWSGPTWCGHSGDRTTIFYNPFRRVWVYSIRATANRDRSWKPATKPVNEANRARKYWESRDFLAGAAWPGNYEQLHGDWPEGSPQYWVGADQLDARGLAPDELKPELYNLDATPYESLMLGLFSIWRRPDDERTGRPKINEVQLGFSRDGFHWDRPFREAVVPVNDDPRAWNYGNVQSVGGGCLIVGDRLYLYASGRNAAAETTGLFFLRRDGFSSMEADENGGTLTTRPVKFSGRNLFVNLAAPAGELRVEVLDRDGEPIAPFTRQDCVATRGDRTSMKIGWKNGDDLSGLAGRAVRFRFHLENGALYSFWVSPDASGASHGYVAAGGPGFTGPTDTVGELALHPHQP